MRKLYFHPKRSESLLSGLLSDTREEEAGRREGCDGDGLPSLLKQLRRDALREIEQATAAAIQVKRIHAHSV